MLSHKARYFYFETLPVLVVTAIIGALVGLVANGFFNYSKKRHKVYQVDNGAICQSASMQSCGLELWDCDDGIRYECVENVQVFERLKK